MGNTPYLSFSDGILKIIKDPAFLSCPGTPPFELEVFKIKSNLNFPFKDFIPLINKIIKKFYQKKIKNIKAFIISLDNLLEFYLDDAETREANNIIEMKFKRKNCAIWKII